MCFDNSRKTVSIFYFWRVFLPKPKLDCDRKMFREPHIKTVFIPTRVDIKLLNFLNWWRHQWRHECMAHCQQNNTSPPIYLQTTVCAVSFHLIQIVGTNIMPNKHTNTIGEDITPISRVINKMNTDKYDQIWTHIPKYFKMSAVVLFLECTYM